MVILAEEVNKEIQKVGATWSASERYVESIVIIKQKIIEFMTIQEYETAQTLLKQELIFCEPYFKKHKEKIVDVEKLLDETEKLLNNSRGKAEVINRVLCKRKLEDASRILTHLEATNNLLQLQSASFENRMMKYGN